MVVIGPKYGACNECVHIAIIYSGSLAAHMTTGNTFSREDTLAQDL